MLKIKIIDPTRNFRLILPVPLKLFIQCFVRESWVMIGINGKFKELNSALEKLPVGEKQKKIQLEKDRMQLSIMKRIVEVIDFRALRMCLSDIDHYKGLVLVDIVSSDGTMVYITL